MTDPDNQSSVPPPEDEPDFAEEHSDLTVAGGDRGGPEGVPESESPRGYGGMDIERGPESAD